MRRTAPLLLALVVAASLAACSHDDDSTDPLASYTDPGDGCHQMVSAIAYAENTLKPLGQEPFQDFTDEVRSNLAAVGGTESLEEDDFPSTAIREQARRTGRFAMAAQLPGAAERARVRHLREFRREAAELVLMCAPYADPTPTSPGPASASASG